ncbi:MAG: beta-L-arabinofuranosidase domain-containing protein [Trebonia sp.]
MGSPGGRDGTGRPRPHVRTGRYLELARLFVERRGARTLASHPFGQEYFQDDIPVRHATHLRALYLAAGAVDVATETSDGDLLATISRQWDSSVTRRTYITGGVGSRHQGEAFGDDFELPPVREFTAGDSLRLAFPGTARITWTDSRIDAARGTFAVERGPLVLALESVDLPSGWDVNEVRADPASVFDDLSGITIGVGRHLLAEDAWPHQAAPLELEGESARVRLIPYHELANRGPGTMRVWIPVSARTSSEPEQESEI